jgi:archaellum biogenesis ATPase FlaH
MASDQKPPDENDKAKAGTLSGDPLHGTNVVELYPKDKPPPGMGARPWPTPPGMGARPWPTPPELVALLGAQGDPLPTGIAAIDGPWRGGIGMGKRWGILGAPGAGKTTWAIQLAHRFAQQGVPVFYIANDEPREGLLIRMGQQSGLYRGMLEQGVPETKEALIDRLRGLPLMILDPDEDEGVTIPSVVERLRQDYPSGPGVVVVDSLQTMARMVTPDVAESPREKVNAILAQCKIGARGSKLLFILLSEMNRGAYRMKGESPTEDIAAGKESGDIEYGVDAMCLLRNVPKQKGLVKVEWPKARMGRIEPFGLHLDHDTATFTEMPLPDSEGVEGGSGGLGDFEEACRAILDFMAEEQKKGQGGVTMGHTAASIHRGRTLVTECFRFLDKRGQIENKGTFNRPDWHLKGAQIGTEEGVDD